MKPISRKLKICYISVIVGALIINGFALFAQWYAVSPQGSDKFIYISVFSVFPLLLAILLIVISPIGLIFKKTRNISKPLLFSNLIYILLAILLMMAGSSLRKQAFHDLAKDSQPLIVAIKKYEVDNKNPPSSLNKLIPKYISSIPLTGMGAYPEYKYFVVTEKYKAAWHENPWVLYVDTPSGFLNWDQFLYFPRGNYPKTGYSGVLVRYGDWAYLHE